MQGRSLFLLFSISKRKTDQPSCCPASPDARPVDTDAALHLEILDGLRSMLPSISKCKMDRAICHSASPDTRQLIHSAV